jgi:hypothetical protein
LASSAYLDIWPISHFSHLLENCSLELYYPNAAELVLERVYTTRASKKADTSNVKLLQDYLQTDAAATEAKSLLIALKRDKSRWQMDAVLYYRNYDVLIGGRLEIRTAKIRKLLRALVVSV